MLFGQVIGLLILLSMVDSKVFNRVTSVKDLIIKKWIYMTKFGVIAEDNFRLTKVQALMKSEVDWLVEIRLRMAQST